MIHKTRGIVLHSVKYSETSLVVKIYTDVFGLQSYMVKGIRKAHSRFSPALFQPMSVLDMAVYHKEKTSLHSLKDVHFSFPYQTIPFDIRKTSVAFFMNELLYRTIREEEPDQPLFDFLLEACTRLDKPSATVWLFPLYFSIQLSRFLGFMPHAEFSSARSIFYLKEGIFQENIPEKEEYLDPELAGYFHSLLICSWDDLDRITIPSPARGKLLEKILHYYQLHMSGFTGLQSPAILHTILS
ncbi:MAG: DNA repair protein RecO [Bacteroidota bacterium]|nr:DNA repair protein RecO [Bacteroidota bacterium]